MEALRRIEPDIGYKFESNGTAYTVEDRLSIARSIKSLTLEVDLFELNTKTIKDTLASAYNDLNGNNKEKVVKFADAAVKMNNLYSALSKNIKFTEIPILRYCALFINADGEDRRIITDEQIDNKINDWQEGGYDISGFFLLVLSVLPHVRKDFVNHMESISKIAEAEQKEKSATPKSKK